MKSKDFSENLTNNQIFYLSQLTLKKKNGEHLNQDIETVIQEVDLRSEMSCFELSKVDDQAAPMHLSITQPFTAMMKSNIHQIQMMTWVNTKFDCLYFVEHGFFYSHPQRNRAEASNPEIFSFIHSYISYSDYMLQLWNHCCR